MNKKEEELFLTLEDNNIKGLQRLIRAGIDLNMKDKHGSPVLHYAAVIDRQEYTQELIKAKASVNIQNNEGFTALHFAAGNGRFHIAEMLIMAGADKGIKNIFGDTPLDLAKEWKKQNNNYEDMRYRDICDIINSIG